MTQKVALFDLRASLPAKVDFFVCSASFESRCLSIANRIQESVASAAIIKSNVDNAIEEKHAAILAAGGLSKDDIRRFVFEQVRLPRALWSQGGMAGMFPDLFPNAADVPIIKSPDDLLIIVVGGFGRHSCWLPTFGDTTRAVTRLIARADGRALRSVNELIA